MNFYSPIYLLFILGLIPLIIMYLLKKQNKDVVLSSNYLWEKALRDVEANKLWQKLKKNLLFILQALAFTLIVIALAKPHTLKGNINTDNLIIVLDKSFSMKNKDIDGLTRFEKAKEEIDEAIDNTKKDTSITLITMDNKPDILISNTNDKSNLKKELQKVSPNDSSENIKDTLSTIKGIVNNTENYEVIFYTDKEINTDIANLKVNKIKGKGENVSIDNLSYIKEEKNMTILTTLTNHSIKKQNFDISIYGDEKVIEVKKVELKNKESKDIYFDSINQDINILKAKIDIKDSLEVDNTRYQLVNNNPTKKVLIVSEQGNIFIEKAIEIDEKIEIYKSNDKLEDNKEGYDLYIFDGKMPEKLPSDGSVVLFNPPNNNIFNISSYDGNGEIASNNDELLKYINLDFHIKKTNIIENTSWLQPVLTLDDKSVIAKGIKDNQKIVIIAFDIKDTDLPLKVDFPILMMNILDYSLNLNTQGNLGIVAGESINLDLLPKVQQVYVTDPNGSKQEVEGTVYTDTYTQGIYTVEQVTDGETIKKYFALNVDTSSEKIEKVKEDTNNINDNKNYSKSIEGKDITKIILILVLIALSFEWVVYNRGY